MSFPSTFYPINDAEQIRRNSRGFDALETGGLTN
jgi:hypothetical protein